MTILFCPRELRRGPAVFSRGLSLGRRLRYDQLFEAVRIAGQVRFSGGKFVEAENIGEKIGCFRTGERAGRRSGHQLLNHVVKIAYGLTRVFGEEIISAKRGIRTRAVKCFPMTR